MRNFVMALLCALGIFFVASEATPQDSSFPGSGGPKVVKYGRKTNLTAVADLTSYSVGGQDGSFLVSSVINITSYTAGNLNMQVVYKDETNATQTVTLQGHFGSGFATSANALGPFEANPIHIRAKASSVITVRANGTPTTLRYNGEGCIQKVQ